MKKFFLVMVFCLMGGAGQAAEGLGDAYQERQRSLLCKEAAVTTKVYGVECPPLIPFDRRMSEQDWATFTNLNTKAWEGYKDRMFTQATRTPELSLALDKLYDHYASAVEAHKQQIIATKNRRLDEMRDALIVDGLEQNSSKLCIPLGGGVVNCF